MPCIRCAQCVFAQVVDKTDRCGGLVYEIVDVYNDYPVVNKTKKYTLLLFS